MAKRLLLATAALLAALTAAAAEDIKLNDAIEFSGPTIACRNLQTVDQFEQWFLATGIHTGNEYAVAQGAPERWAATHGCEIWRNGRNLFVVNTDPRVAANSMVKVCVSSMFILKAPGPKLGSNDCTWLFINRQSVAVQPY